jgi:hypothetical protein
MAVFALIKRLAMTGMIKQVDCLSERQTPLFFDYTLKKDTLLKTCP